MSQGTIYKISSACTIELVIDGDAPKNHLLTIYVTLKYIRMEYVLIGNSVCQCAGMRRHTEEKCDGRRREEEETTTPIWRVAYELAREHTAADIQ